MLEWLLVAALYVAGIAFFRLIGGLDSAADGLKKWGAAYSERQRARNRLPSAFRSPRDRRDDSALGRPADGEIPVDRERYGFDASRIRHGGT